MFIPREGEPKLLVSGAPNMLSAARRLTWIEAVEPLRDAGKTIVQWMDKPAGSGESTSRNRPALIGGDYMRGAFHASFMEAFGAADYPCDATSSLHALMRCKSSRELAFIREGCAILDAAMKALAEGPSRRRRHHGGRPRSRTCRQSTGRSGCTDTVQCRWRPDLRPFEETHRFHRRSASSVYRRSSR